jgi:hypothetical protein
VIVFLNYNLSIFDLKLEINSKGREGVDFLINDKHIYLESIDLDNSISSVKCKKPDLGELKKDLIPELAKYALENMISKLKMLVYYVK